VCVSIPAQVVSTAGPQAQVRINGQLRSVLLTVEATAGDWVLIYAGAVIGKVDEEFARESLALFGSAMNTEIPT
jgi:hydrogenase expression/formation protein HypC